MVIKSGNGRPDILATIAPAGTSFDLPVELGYEKVTPADARVALWVRSHDHRVTKRSDRTGSAAFFGLTTTSNAIDLIPTAGERCTSEFLERPYTFIGHYAAFSAGDDVASVLTDHFGSVPIYSALAPEDPRVWIAGTNLGDVAELADHTEVDPVSAFEFVQSGVITNPHTIFDGVRRIGPGTVATVTISDGRPSIDERRYWQPGDVNDDVDVGDAAQTMATTMRANLRDLLDQYRQVTLLMSGGEDSRILAKYTRELRPGTADLRAVIFIDAPNREWKLAKYSADMIKIDLEPRHRSADHYTSAISEMVALAGGGIDLTHAHSTGLIDPTEADLFLDGWSADSFYKAHTIPVDNRKIGGVKVSLDKPGTIPASLGPDHWRHTNTGREVLARRERKLAGLLEIRTPSDARAWTNLWPISDHPEYGLFASNWRSRPSASPYMFANLVALAAPIGTAHKINRTLFHRAFAQSMGRVGWIPRTGGQIPRLGARTNLVATNVVKAFFRLTSLIQRRRGVTVAQGPWQSFSTRRAAIADAMEAASPSLVSRADEFGRGLSGPDDRDSDETGRWSTDQSHRILQLAALLDQVQPGSRD